MLNVIRKFVSVPPKEDKDVFFREIYRENLVRLILCCLILIVAETGVYCLFRDRIFGTGTLLLFFIAGSLLFFPVFLLLYRKQEAFPGGLVHAVEFLYLVVIIIIGCALSLAPQKELATINTYEIAVFGIACFFVLRPLESFLLFFAAYSGFFLFFPYFQTDPNILLVLRLNAFIMTVLAWLLSRLVFGMRLRFFLDKKTIEEKNRELKELTTRDSMTSLLNHDNCFVALGKELERAKRFGQPLSVIMMDIDDFKKINDGFGHRAGDEVIVEIARSLIADCRATDILGRYGGEEYLLIMPNTDLAEAAVMAERIRSTIEGIAFPNGIRVTISGGISEFAKETPERLLESADRKLYRAKALGKNRFETVTA